MRRFITMLVIKDRAKVPRELYGYKVPETGAEFEAHGFGALLVHVKKNYAANNLPVPENLARIVEQNWCERYPYHCQDPDHQIVEQEAEKDMLADLIASAAIPAADALAAVSKALGIHCQSCQTRHRIIREMRKLGFKETLRRLKESFAK